ncbi:hypothetical protein [Rosistilla oblonga]|uniref:Uncharacterized protein n=1 Tax=Rosistilla oblonga TaxID=2527990 RepID=A0A518IQU3_9BACT|nr:hypothetical protein [Rosistilla oblonga]QDV55462.1 hypothetical protein Mal33_14360 [Rosistilla oblonga]
MLRTLRWLAVPCLCFAVVAVGDAPQAKAQTGGFSIQFGTPSYGYGGYNRSYRPSYGYGYGSSARIYSQHRSYYGGHHPHRPHYDYHRPSLVPHGNRYHYVPGHYDLHRGHHGHHGHRDHGHRDNGHRGHHRH